MPTVGVVPLQNWVTLTEGPRDFGIAPGWIEDASDIVIEEVRKGFPMRRLIARLSDGHERSLILAAMIGRPSPCWRWRMNSWAAAAEANDMEAGAADGSHEGAAGATGPWQRLYFRPLPQGQGWFRPGFTVNTVTHRAVYPPRFGRRRSEHGPR